MQPGEPKDFVWPDQRRVSEEKRSRGKCVALAGAVVSAGATIGGLMYATQSAEEGAARSAAIRTVNAEITAQITALANAELRLSDAIAAKSEDATIVEAAKHVVSAASLFMTATSYQQSQGGAVDGLLDAQTVLETASAVVGDPAKASIEQSRREIERLLRISVAHRAADNGKIRISSANGERLVQPISHDESGRAVYGSEVPLDEWFSQQKQELGGRKEDSDD